MSAIAKRGSCNVPATITDGVITAASRAIVPFRAALIDQPRVTSADDSQPAARHVFRHWPMPSF